MQNKKNVSLTHFSVKSTHLQFRLTENLATGLAPIAANPNVIATVPRSPTRNPMRVRMRADRPASAHPDPMPAPFPAARHPDKFRAGCNADDFHLRCWRRFGDNHFAARRRRNGGVTHINRAMHNAAGTEQQAGTRDTSKNQSRNFSFHN